MLLKTVVQQRQQLSREKFKYILREHWYCIQCSKSTPRGTSKHEQKGIQLDRLHEAIKEKLQNATKSKKIKKINLSTKKYTNPYPYFRLVVTKIRVSEYLLETAAT